MRYYPTDVLIAVERARTEHIESLFTGDRTAVAPLDPAGFAGGLDTLFDGLGQYPFRPLRDGGVDVYRPVGTVVIDDRSPAATLRGLLLAWATGNDVVIRSSRGALWDGVLGELRRAQVPLPPARVLAPGEPVSGVVVEVPEVTIARHGEPAADPAALAIRVGPGVSEEEALRGVLALDCRAPWVRRLFRVEHLVGVSLAAARGAENGAERIDAKLRYLLQRARRTPYYRDFPAITGRADLTTLPVLDKTTLDAHTLPLNRDLSSDAAPSGEVLRSGATTGAPRYIVYSRTDWANMVREAIPVFYAAGLAGGDRMINALFGGSLYGGLITSSCELSQMPVECYTTGQHVTADELLGLVRTFSANAILGQPALILPLLREAKSREPALRLEKIIYGGTAMTDTDRAWLRDELGVHTISSIVAANDGAQLGYQCTELSGMLHHICDDYNLIEVVDDDERPVPEGEPGHLLVTCMQKYEGPLIRYRIGDVGRVFHHDCACGVSGPVLEYLGRSDGLIKVKARTVLYREVLEALSVFGVSQLQVEIVSTDGTDTVIVRTESPAELDPTKVHALLNREFEALSDRHAFGDGMDVFRLVVECLPEGRLPRNSVSGKIKPVIDRRLE